MKQLLSYADWLTHLCKVMIESGFAPDTVLDRDAWRSYYDDGYMPEDAFEKDMRYG